MALQFRQPCYHVRGAMHLLHRRCVTVLEDDSFAANGIKHCVRPADMAGKSAALILRWGRQGLQVGLQ